MPVRDYTLNYSIDATGAAAGFTIINDGFKLLQKNTFFATKDLAALEAQLAMLTAALPAAVAAMGTFNTQLTAAGATHIHVGDKTVNHSSAVKELGNNVIITAAAFQGLAIAIDTVGELGEKIAQVRQKIVEMAEATMELRGEMRELANLENKNGPDDEVVAGAVEFGLKAAMTPKQATEFMNQYLGSAPAGLQRGNIGDGKHAGESQEDYEKRVKPISDEIALAGAQFGQRVGLSPQTAGDISGVMSQFGQVGSGREASQKWGQLAYGLNEGRGRLEPLMRVLANTAGAIVDESTGAVESLPELAVMLGVMSTHHAPAQAGTYLQKAGREVRKELAKDGSEAGDVMRTLGVEQNMTTMQAIKKMAPAIKEAQSQGVDPENWFRNSGFKDQAGIRAMVELYKDIDLYDARMEKSKQITGEDVEKKNEAFFTRDLAGIRLKQNSADEAGKFLKGHEAEKVNLARQAAVTRLRDAGALNSTEQQLADKVNDAMGIAEWVGMPDSFKMRVDQEVYETLLAQARNAGLDKEADEFEAKINGLSDTGSFTYNMLNRPDVQQEITGFMNTHGEKMLERGASPFGGSGGVRAKVHAIGRSKEEKAKLEAAKKMDPNAPKTPVNLADPFANRRRPGETRQQFNDRKFLSTAPAVGGEGNANDFRGMAAPDPVIVNPPMRLPGGKTAPLPAGAAPNAEHRMKMTDNGAGGGGGSDRVEQLLSALLEETQRQHGTIRDGGGMPLMEYGGFGPERA